VTEISDVIVIPSFCQKEEDNGKDKSQGHKNVSRIWHFMQNAQRMTPPAVSPYLLSTRIIERGT